MQSCKAATSNSCFKFLLQFLPVWGLKPDSRNSDGEHELGLFLVRQNWCELQQCRLTALWGLVYPTILPKETFWSQVWASQVGAAAPQHQPVLSAARCEWDTTPFFLQIHQISRVSFPSFCLNVSWASSCSFSVLFLLFESSQDVAALIGKILLISFPGWQSWNHLGHTNVH